MTRWASREVITLWRAKNLGTGRPGVCTLAGRRVTWDVFEVGDFRRGLVSEGCELKSFGYVLWRAQLDGTDGSARLAGQ